MNTRNRAWQYLEKLFEYCIKENRCPDLLAYLFDKQQFKKILAGHEKSSIEEAYTHFVNTIIGKINGKLFFGGNELAVIGDTFYIENIDEAPALPFEYADICNSTEDYYDMADRYMIDNCDFVVAVTVGDEEPDAVEYAESKGKQIVYFDAETLKVKQ